MSWTLGNSSSLWAAGEDQFCKYFFPLSGKIKDILKINFFVYVVMINVMVRACLTQEIKDISNLIEVKN